jgi:hypothetical protein
MSGPECDWCGADEEDMDINQVGGEFVCNECCEIAGAGRELLAACKKAVTALNVKPKFRVGFTDSYAIAAMCEKAIKTAEGGGE